MSSGLKKSEAIENPWLVRILGGILAAAMVCAVYGAVERVYADHLARTDSAETVRAALKIAPENAEYWLHSADLAEANGRSGRSGVEHATQLDPYNSAVWIRAGLTAEINGDDAGAERALLRAAQLSRQYEPRWALANYYFRQGDAVHFWPWAKSALEWAYRDRKLLFDLCWRMQPDPRVILDRGIPDNPKVLRDYLEFLLDTNRPQAAQAVAERMQARASNEDRDLLLAYVNRMLEAHDWRDALSMWNALCLRKLVPHQPLDPEHGQGLTNGSFSIKPLDTGYDWRLPQASGISTAYSDSTSGMRFDFDGQQPEYSWLLYQVVPLEPRRRYDLRFGYRTDGIPAAAGLRWQIFDGGSEAEIPLEQDSPPSFSSADWTKSAVTFTVPPQVQTAKVVLVYKRQPGTVRIEGTLWLRNVELESHP